MKFLLVFLFGVSLFFISCKERNQKDPMNIQLSETSAKKDFGLFRNLLQEAHPSLTLYKSKKNIDFLFDSINTTFSGSITLRDFYTRLYFLCNEIGCSHTDVFLPSAIYDTLRNRKLFFPFPIVWIENKLLINVTGYELPEGSQIASINGVSTKQILDDLTIYNSIEGFHRQAQLDLAAKDFSFQYYLRWGAQDKFDLKVIDTLGHSKNVSVEPITYGEWNERNDYNKYYFDGVAVDYDLIIDNDKRYATLRLPTFDFSGYQRQAAFENFCSNSFELLKSKKNITRLIIDIRENTGGKLNGAFLLFSYLARNPFNEFDYVSSKINTLPYSGYLDRDFARNEMPDVTHDLQEEFVKNRNGLYYYVDSLKETWALEKNRFLGEVFVITNATTVSAASYFSLMVKNTGVGKIVGVETAGGSYSGNGFKNLEYVLPISQIKLMFPYAHLVYTFKEKKNTGRGVIPDYVVPDTYQSFKNNDDKQVQYIIDSLFLN
jgi:Peptidase family S41